MKEEDGKEIMGKARKEIYRSLFFKEDEVSLFSYIDNVLAHHFNTFQEEIKKLYEQNNNLF